MSKSISGVLLFLLALAVPFGAGPEAKEKEKDVKGHAVQSGTPTLPNDDPNYVIGAEDMLDISVWKEPDVSRAVPVRPDGKISLPLRHDIQAAGLTPMQLQARITESLKKYITDPQVTVIVTAVNSRRIYILGEVVRTGAFPLLMNMTVLQALSAAGGFGQFADQRKIYVLR